MNSTDSSSKTTSPYFIHSLPGHHVNRIQVYETQTNLYLVGDDKHLNGGDGPFEVLRIDRTKPEQLSVSRLPWLIGSAAALKQFLTTIDPLRTSPKRLDNAVGIMGFVRFVQGWYVVLISRKKKVAAIGTHHIYAVNDIVLQSIAHPSHKFLHSSGEESRYVQLFFGLDLSGIYFSYTYDLTRPLQYSMSHHLYPLRTPQPLLHYANDKYVWNRFLLQPLLDIALSSLAAAAGTAVDSPSLFASTPSTASLAAYGLHGSGDPAAGAALHPLSAWVLPVIHGYVAQSTLASCGSTLTLTLLARRSRHYAGVRYLKRGVTPQGHCANDVETEQLLADTRDGVLRSQRRITAYVQSRGSIPLFWTQENAGLSPKPPISFVRSDPFYDAAVQHLSELLASYGNPVVILSLIKTREKVPREMLLKNEFEACLSFLSHEISVRCATVASSTPTGPVEADDTSVKVSSVDSVLCYEPWDFHYFQKMHKADPITQLTALAQSTLSRTGFFCASPLRASDSAMVVGGVRGVAGVGREQRGVVRTNCVDSLDRTNAAQFCIAKVVLAFQLHALGLIESPQLEFDHQLVAVLMALFEDMGNQVAVQYGGSELAHTMKAYHGKEGNISRDLLTTVRRFYNNSFTDVDKQMAINLFLGKYVPWQERERLWDLETDYHLHMHHVVPERPLSSDAWWLGPLALHDRQPASALSSAATTNGQGSDARHTHALNRFHRTCRLSNFDKLLVQPHNNVQWIERDESKPRAAQYLPGVRRWFSDRATTQTNGGQPSAPTSNGSNSSSVVSKEDSSANNTPLSGSDRKAVLSPMPSSASIYGALTQAHSVVPPLVRNPVANATDAVANVVYQLYGIRLYAHSQDESLLRRWVQLESLVQRQIEPRQREIYDRYVRYAALTRPSAAAVSSPAAITSSASASGLAASASASTSSRPSRPLVGGSRLVLSPQKQPTSTASSTALFALPPLAVLVDETPSADQQPCLQYRTAVPPEAAAWQRPPAQRDLALYMETFARSNMAYPVL